MLSELDSNGIRVYPLPDCDSDEDEDYRQQVRDLKAAVPFAVVGASAVIEVGGKKVRINKTGAMGANFQGFRPIAKRIFPFHFQNGYSQNPINTQRDSIIV